MITPEPSLRLRVDKEALRHNWKNLDGLSGTAKAGAAIKADAYGLGAAIAAPVLREAGCRNFFVAHWGEAATATAFVPPSEVSVLHGPMTDADTAFAKALGVRPVINSLSQAQRWIDAGGGSCDLMVDTGINRLGLSMDELGDPLVGKLSVDMLLSHLACADEASPLNAMQLARWNEARAQVRHARASLANSAGIALGPDYHGDVTRPGLALYGGVPCSALAGAVRQVAHPEAALIQVRMVEAGDSVGYNATFTAPMAMRIGIVSLGYADGYLRCWSDKGAMLHTGRSLPVLGRVSMDMTAIDLSAADDLAEGDWVEAAYDLPAASSVSGLSQYELLTSLGRRFSR